MTWWGEKMGNDFLIGPHEDKGYRCDRPEGYQVNMVRVFTVLLLGLVCLAGAAQAEDDPLDKAVIEPMVKHTLEFERTGTNMRWSNPETGSRGIVRVERTYYRDANTPCRDYIRTTKQTNGAEATTRGTGCRMGDGRWFLDESPDRPAPKAAAGAPAGPKDEKVAAAPPVAPKTETSEVSGPSGPETAKATGPDEPADDAAGDTAGDTAVEEAPLPARAKPRALAPDYTMPSKSAL